MLLLTQILRPRYRGVIHLRAGDGGGRPEIEFSGGEGPEQVMDRIQDFAVPEILGHVETLGPFLRWQELDLEAGLVRRHRSSFPERLEFDLCPDERGIELVLAEGEGEARPWVPLGPHLEPGPEQRTQIGWTVATPRLAWRYLQTRYAPPAIEVAWSCASLPGEWAAGVLARHPLLECRIGDAGCTMNPSRDGLLVYRGHHPLPIGDPRPACRHLRLRQPLVVLGPEADDPCHLVDEAVVAQVEAQDFRARLDGRSTRLVADADLDRPFAAEVLTGGDVLLPATIPAGLVPGLPWPLAAAAVGIDDGTRESPPSRRRWLLSACPRRGERGSWGEAAWRGEPPELAFGLGPESGERAPRVHRIANRRASVGWRIEAGDEGGRLCLAVPSWVPVGCPDRVALPGHDASESGDFEYAAEVRARLDGLEERFVIDQRSELPASRLFLGPRRWRFRDGDGAPVDGGAVLGEASGCVRWRRDAGGANEAPTDWAGGSAPVLLMRGGGDALQWGGLYAPRAVPWNALEEVAPVPAAPMPAAPESPAGGGEVLLVPGVRGASGEPELPPAIWIDLQGFVCRYDVLSTTFARSHGETSRPIAWLAETGLELFPRRGGYLLRSFSPLYAVRDPDPRRFDLQLASPRPILRLGRDLDAPMDLGLDVGDETYVRHQLTEPGELPRSFEPGRVPGTRLRLDRIGRRVAWLAIEQRDGGDGRRAGYLLSWDAASGWRFRGFYAHPGAAALLGVTRRGGAPCRVLLGGTTAGRARAFRLTLDAGGHRWSDGAPEPLRRRLSAEMIRRWERHHYAPERRPAPLRDYGLRVRQQAAGDRPWIFELFEGAEADAVPPAGIRVWQPHGDPGELSGGARALDDDPIDRLPAKPEKRILRADEDDDF